MFLSRCSDPASRFTSTETDSENDAGPSPSVISSRRSGPIHKSYDIGAFVSESTDADKIFIVEHEWTPPPDFSWPTSTHMENGRTKERRLTPFHLKKHPWIAYSVLDSGLYCRFCAVFAQREVGSSRCQQSAGALVTKPLKVYKNMTSASNRGILDMHATRQYHRNAVEAAASFVATRKDRQKDIRFQLDAQAGEEERLARDRLLPIMELITVCGKQNIALRGHEDSGRVGGSSQKNEGNFRALLRYRAGADLNLKKHLESAPLNAQYTSPTVQNEVINCIGDMMVASVVEEIQKSEAGPCYAVLADETSDIEMREQLSIFVRYVTDSGELKEKFLGFKDVHQESFDLDFAQLGEDEVMEPKLTGRLLGKCIQDSLENVGLSVSQCVGQGYDGAATMSSELKGAATVISEQNPMAVYVHCSSHSLNLALVTACRQAPIRNMYGVVRNTVDFITSSPKRKAVFQAAVSFKCPGAMRKRLKSLCATRWVERHEALDTFIELYPAVLLTLEQLAKWKDATTASKAGPLLNAVTEAVFLVSLHSTADVMALTRPLAIALQGEQQDLNRAVELVCGVQRCLRAKREKADDEFTAVYAKAQESHQKATGVDISKPRTSQKQTKRSNPEASDAETYFRVCIYVPLLDDILAQLDSRFTPHMKKAMRLNRLVPASTEFEGEEEFFHEALQLYRDLMPPHSVETARGELRCWRSMWSEKEPSDRPKTPLEALQQCSRTCFPLVWRVLRIAACQPVTTASVERSFSILKRVKTWLRSTMGETRLSALALMACHPDAVPAPRAVLERFMLSKKRRIQ